MKNNRIYLSPPHMSGQEKELLIEVLRSINKWIPCLCTEWQFLAYGYYIYTVRISRIIANGTWETFDIIDKKSSVKIIQLI